MTNALRILKPLEITFTYEGEEFTFYHVVDDIIAKTHRKGKFYELDLLERLRRLLKSVPPEDIVLDVGAHVGNHAVYLSRVCGRSVFAFEPNPATLTCLRRQELPGRLEPLEWAVADGALGSMKWFSGAVNSGNVGFQQAEGGDVVSITLDKFGGLEGSALELASLRCCLLKLDIEGGEELALQHGQKFLERNRPIVVVEDKISRDKAQWRTRQTMWFDLLPSGYRYEGRYASTPTHIFLPPGGVA